MSGLLLDDFDRKLLADLPAKRSIFTRAAKQRLDRMATVGWCAIEDKKLFVLTDAGRAALAGEGEQQ